MRRKYPIAPYILLVTFSVLCMVLGSKLFTYDPDQLKSLLTGVPLVDNGRKTILGAMAGGIIGACLAKKLLWFRYPFFDLTAAIFPLAMAIQKVGYLFAGCCFGHPTTLPWAISYGIHSHAYHSQLAEGLIRPGALASLPVHPVAVSGDGCPKEVLCSFPFAGAIQGKYETEFSPVPADHVSFLRVMEMGQRDRVPDIIAIPSAHTDGNDLAVVPMACTCWLPMGPCCNGYCIFSDFRTDSSGHNPWQEKGILYDFWSRWYVWEV